MGSLIEEARTWLGTPYSEQQRIKGVGVGCASLIAEAVFASGDVVDAELEASYRGGVFSSPVLRGLLERHFSLVQGSMSPGDLLILRDVRDVHEPRHVMLLTQLEPYPKVIHADTRQVSEHRLDAWQAQRVHSVWRRGVGVGGELEAMKRAEVNAAIEKRVLADPFTTTVFGSVILAHILGAAAISAVAALGDGPYTRTLPRREGGR
jgi:hypothetical protein